MCPKFGVFGQFVRKGGEGKGKGKRGGKGGEFSTASSFY